MPKEFSRTERLGEQVRRELSLLIRDALRDPRVGMVSLTEVRVAKDLSTAKVFVTLLGDESARADCVQALNHAAGFLRRELGGLLKLRRVPTLRFVYDESVERGAHMDDLIKRL